MTVSRGSENVRRQAAIPRARLDEIKSWLGARGWGLGCKQRRHLCDLHREQFAEYRADVDAGKKIARAAGTLGRAGVVAVIGIVERELHERGHSERTAITDQVLEPGLGARDSGLDRQSFF